MPELTVLLLVGALLIQYPIGVWMYFDARHLNLKNPEMYYLGVIVPAGGFIVILYYISNRADLPKKTTNDS